MAKQVGIGAIIFNDLYNQRIKDVLFDWDKLLNFDGETGPYVQSHTHGQPALSERSEILTLQSLITQLLTDDASMALLKEISRFPEVVKDASEKYELALLPAMQYHWHRLLTNSIMIARSM